jgi:hypothetical protein
MVKKPKKHHIVAATATVMVGTAVLVGTLRGSGGADGPTVRLTEIVDRCGDVVRTTTGEAYLVEVRLDPPAREGTVVDTSGTVDGTPPDEADLVAVPILADPRLTTRAALSCG